MSASTLTSTSSKNETSEEIVYNDKVRYIRKGYGLVVAVLITLSFYFIFPSVVQPVYVQWMSLFSDQLAAYFWGNLLVHHLFFVLGNSVMFIIYKLEL
jgi:hypothetical protein